MTEKAVEALIAASSRDRIVSLRYLAWLDAELRALIRELNPEHQAGDYVMFPCDTQVHNLIFETSPLERAATVLEAVGIDPRADDCWTDHLDINPRNIPFAGTVK